MIMTQQFHKSWLKVTALVVGSFGPIFFWEPCCPPQCLPVGRSTF